MSEGVLHAQESCHQGFFKKPTELLTFSVVEKVNTRFGHQGKKDLSINYTFFPVAGKLLQVQSQSIMNILNMFPSRCSCKYVQGLV